MKNGLFCVSYKGQVKDEIGRPRHMFKVEIEKRNCSDFFFALSPKGHLVMGSKDFQNLDKDLKEDIVLTAMSKIPVD